MAREIRTQAKNIVVYEDGTIRIDNVRASYPHLAKAYKGDDQDGTPKFSITGFGTKSTHAAASKIIVSIRDSILKEKNEGKKIAADKVFWRDGDLSGKPEYEGCFTLACSETKRPSVRGSRKEVLSESEIENMIYAGCYVNILIRPWWQDNKFGKRINANLLAVQFVRDGEPIGEGRISEEDVDDSFDEVAEDEDEMDTSDTGGL